jgi:hypothetical protein
MMGNDGKDRLRDAVTIAIRVVPPRWVLVFFALSIGIVGEVLYAFAVRPWLATFSASLLFSLAALVAGGLFGFLFGLPHAGGGTSSAPRKPPAEQGGGAIGSEQVALDLGPQTSEATPSTNLQQIADWLTKLILGAGLTQLGRLPHGSYVLFHAMSPSIGASPSATAVVGGIVIYFAVLGFVIGWLATYFLVTPAVTRVEKSAASLIEGSGLLAASAARARSAGREDEARRLELASAGQEDRARSLLASYTSIYARPRSDSTRIPDLDQAIAREAQKALDAKPTAEEVKAKYERGSQREREVSLAMMATDPSKADLDVVINSISRSKTAVEQYQALRVAMAFISHLTADQASRLRAAVESEANSGEHFSRASERYRLAEGILSQLRESP